MRTITNPDLVEDPREKEALSRGWKCYVHYEGGPAGYDIPSFESWESPGGIACRHLPDDLDEITEFDEV